MSDTSQGPGWWLASDGRWYPPTAPPGYVVLAPPNPAYAPPLYSGYHQGPASRPTNALAIASLILSILWFFGLGSVLAVIFALVALSKIRASHGAQDGRGLAFAGLIIGICGLIGTVGLVLILQVTVGGINQLNKQIQSSEEPTVTHLGVTLNVGDSSATGITRVLVQDLAYPDHINNETFAIASVRVCAGAGGAQSGPDPYAFLVGFRGGQEVHSDPDPIPSLGSNACTDAEVYFQIAPGTSPIYVAYQPGLIHQYRWLVPASLR